VLGLRGHFQPQPSRGFHLAGVRVCVDDLQLGFPLPVEREK